MNVHIALFITVKEWRPKYPLTDEWIKRKCIYTMEYYSAVKKMKCYNMDEP